MYIGIENIKKKFTFFKILNCWKRKVRLLDVVCSDISIHTFILRCETMHAYYHTYVQRKNKKKCVFDLFKENEKYLSRTTISTLVTRLFYEYQTPWMIIQTFKETTLKENKNNWIQNDTDNHVSDPYYFWKIINDAEDHTCI